MKKYIVWLLVAVFLVSTAITIIEYDPPYSYVIRNKRVVDDKYYFRDEEKQWHEVDYTTYMLYDKHDRIHLKEPSMLCNVCSVMSFISIVVLLFIAADRAAKEFGMY